MRPALVVGVPRSGTTWVATVLARGADAGYLEEPDNHLRFAYAFRAKRRLGLGSYPALASDADAAALTDYEALWREAFSPTRASTADGYRRRVANRLLTAAGSRRISAALGAPSARPALRAAAALAVPERAVAARLVVKSVYAPLAVEWIAHRHDVAVIVVLRHPLNVVSSWLRLGWLPPAAVDPVATADPRALAALVARFEAGRAPVTALGRAAWLIGLLTCSLDEAARRHSGWCRVVHEELCADPRESFPELARAAGLPWSATGDRILVETDRPGEGYETARVTAALPTAWRERLSSEQASEIQDVLDTLPLPSFSPRARSASAEEGP